MEIADIKKELTLAQVLGYYGLKPDKQLRLNCPFHPDKTPSLQVYWKTHTCYCFSSNCKTHGKSLDVIDFIMHKESCTKHEALKKATELLKGNSNGKTTTPTLTREQFLQNMFTYFKNAVHNSPPAKEYLQGRNLDYKKLEIGYNGGQFHHGKRKNEQGIKTCLQYGLLHEHTGLSRTGDTAYQPFGKWCVVFALRNKNHEIVSMYFRSTLNNKEQRHFYLKDRQGLYPCYPKADTKKLILTESIIDAATLLQQEEINTEFSVLAQYGTNGLTQEHVNAIRELKQLEEIIFFLNGDNAGRSSVNRYAPMLKNEFPHLVITNTEPPEGEDINSLIQSHKPEILLHLIQSRKPYETKSITNTVSFSVENKKPVDQLTTTEVKHTEKAKLNGHSNTQTAEAQQTPAANKKTLESRLNIKNPFNVMYTGVAALYSIKGGQWLKQPLESMKIALQVIHPQTRNDYRTRVDLYEYKQVAALSAQVAEKLVLRADNVEKDLSILAHLLEEYREENNAQQVNNPHTHSIKVGESTQQKCIEFWNKPELMYRLNELIGRAGIVGEEVNRILLFVIASSYKMRNTMHALIQGSSGSGKTRLLQIVSELMPVEDVRKYTRVTDSSFYNQDEYFFVNKLVCFEDYDGLKDDAQLAVRELQSNEILISSTSIKDESGKITGGERIVRGPIASMACTTKGEVYEDNISRCFVIAVDEGKEQTKRIIQYQNQVAAGMVDKSKEKSIREFLQNCIRVLKPVEVVNPYATRIHLPEEAHKIRRLNELYQSLVKQITILHQYQRKRDEQHRLIAEKTDLQTACEIMFESILLKVDELDGSLRQFYEKLKDFVKGKGKDYEFNRFEIRQSTGVSKTQQHVYINRLVNLEYVQQYGFANRGYRYKIIHWDNMEAIRAKIKDSLQHQLQELEVRQAN